MEHDSECVSCLQESETLDKPMSKTYLRLTLALSLKLDLIGFVFGASVKAVIFIIFC